MFDQDNGAELYTVTMAVEVQVDDGSPGGFTDIVMRPVAGETHYATREWMQAHVEDLHAESPREAFGFERI